MDSFLFSMDWVLPLRSDWATPIAQGFTWMGYTPFFLMFLPIGYWLWDRSIFTRLTVLVAITAVINGWFKEFWQDPRPEAQYQLDGREAGSPGRPSGHTQVAVAMWLWLAYEINRPWAWIVGVILAVGVSFSRLYLGVHDVDDVLIGAAFALLTLAAFYVLTRPGNSLVEALKRSVIAQLVLVAVMVPLVAAVWPEVPEASAETITLEISLALTVLFLLAGWLAGAALDKRLAPERGPRPAWWQMGVIAVGGVVVLFALRAGIEAAGAFLGLGDIATGFAGALILGFYMTGLAPMAFRAIGLMR